MKYDNTARQRQYRIWEAQQAEARKSANQKMLDAQFRQFINYNADLRRLEREKTALTQKHAAQRRARWRRAQAARERRLVLRAILSVVLTVLIALAHVTHLIVDGLGFALLLLCMVGMTHTLTMVYVMTKRKKPQPRG